MKKLIIIISAICVVASCGIYGYFTYRNYDSSRAALRIKVEAVADAHRAFSPGSGDKLKWSLAKGAALKAALRHDSFDEYADILRKHAEDELDDNRVGVLASALVGREITQVQFERDRAEIYRKRAERWAEESH